MCGTDTDYPYYRSRQESTIRTFRRCISVIASRERNAAFVSAEPTKPLTSERYGMMEGQWSGMVR